MATRIRQELVDDVDGSDAIDTFNFSFEGIDYAIDLNELHAKELSTDMDKWIGPARRIGGKKKASSNGSSTAKNETKEIRAWAKANGWPDLSNVGRVPIEAEDAYRQANPG